MPITQDTHDLQLRVLDLEVRIEELDARFQALGDLVDRVVVLVKEAHGEDLPGFDRLTRAAEEALRP